MYNNSFIDIDNFDKIVENELNNNSENENVNNNCSNCFAKNSVIYDSENFNYICTNCGHIQNNKTLYEDESQIDNNNISVYNYKNINTAFLKSVKNKTLTNIYKWNSYTFAEMENIKLLNRIHMYCEKLNIKKNIEDNVIIFYKIIIKNKTNADIKNQQVRNVSFRGKNKTGMIGACIFYACKKNNCMKSIKEIALCLKIPTKSLNKSCNEFLKIMAYINYNYDFNISTTKTYLLSYALKLSINSKQTDQINNLLDYILNHNLFILKVPHIKVIIAILIFIILSKKNLNKQLINNKYILDFNYVRIKLNISRSLIETLICEINDLNLIQKKKNKYILCSKIYQNENKKILNVDVSELYKINNISLDEYPNLLYLDKIKSCF